jgi:ankyrin repeat protein
MASDSDILTLAAADDVDGVRRMLDANPDLLNYQVNEYGNTPLKEAVKAGAEQVVNLLLGRGADVNLREPIFEALKYGQFEIAEQLVDAGADLDELNFSGESILSELTFYNKFDALVFAHETLGADIDMRDGEDNTALFAWVDYYGGLDTDDDFDDTIANYLIRKGLDINAVNVHGISVLTWLRGRYRSVPMYSRLDRWLVDRGARAIRWNPNTNNYNNINNNNDNNNDDYNNNGNYNSNNNSTISNFSSSDVMNYIERRLNNLNESPSESAIQHLEGQLRLLQGFRLPANNQRYAAIRRRIQALRPPPMNNYNRKIAATTERVQRELEEARAPLVEINRRPQFRRRTSSNTLTNISSNNNVPYSSNNNERRFGGLRVKKRKTRRLRRNSRRTGRH